MITDKLKELASARAKLEALEQSVSIERNRELAGLPTRYGFDSVDAFIAALREASGKRRGRKVEAGRGTATVGSKRRKRAVITDATRADVKKLVGEGK